MKTFNTVADFAFNRSVLFAQRLDGKAFLNTETIPEGVAVSVKYKPALKSLLVTVYFLNTPSDKDIKEIEEGIEQTAAKNTELSFDESFYDVDAVNIIKTELDNEPENLEVLKSLIKEAVIVDGKINGHAFYKLATLGLSAFAQQGKIEFQTTYKDGQDVNFDIYY